ncbi:MAG TPA: BTAD domain-containing putative transcriptional regulator [Candidatus Baltobacteraceae bacterium]|nr:BTAD domain-containing putative transcriptional regulator [Candidatus Baltobacteraceae bacterium]
MTLCAAVHDLTLDELSLVFGHGALEVERLLRTALLIRRDGDCLHIHPLMREVLLQNDADWRELVAWLAEKIEGLGGFSRAAELYRIAGSDDAAARALSALPLGVLQGGAHAFDLSSLPLSMLEKYPKLIAAAGVHRSDISTQRLAATFEALTERQDSEVVVAVAQAYAGRLTDPVRATQVLHHPLVRAAAESSPVVRLQLAGWEETIAVHFGAAAGVQARLQAAYSALQSGRLPFHRARIAHYLDVVCKRRGHREESLYWAGEAIAAGRECGPRERAGLLLAAIYTAWFWGDDDTAAAYIAELQTASSATHHPDYAWAMRALDPQTMDSALPLWDASTTLLGLTMAAAKRFGRERELLLQRALARCEETGTPCFTTLFARAVSEPHMRVQDCERIIAMADPAELPEFRTAVRAYMQGKPSFLDEFARRFAADAGGEVRPAHGSLRLEVLRERVIYEGQAYRLTPREAALLAYLTRHRIGTPREEIQDALWPDLDLLAARDSLYSMLHRLRKRVRGAHQLVEGIGNAYRLGDEVQVDLWDIEFVAQRVQRSQALTDTSDVERWYAYIQTRAHPHLQQLEWFAPIEFRVREQVRTLGRRLIAQAQERNDVTAILRLASDLIEEDPCDEWAHGVVIQLHLAQNDRIEAMRAYRRYCTLLEQQICSKPSPEMQEMARTKSLA